MADLGMPDAEERLLKSKLSLLIKRSIDARGLSQTAAAALVGMPQPDVNAIVCGRLKGFSAERLIRALNALGTSNQARERGRPIRLADAAGMGPSTTRIPRESSATGGTIVTRTFAPSATRCLTSWSIVTLRKWPDRIRDRFGCAIPNNSAAAAWVRPRAMMVESSARTMLALATMAFASKSPKACQALGKGPLTSASLSTRLASFFLELAMVDLRLLQPRLDQIYVLLWRGNPVLGFLLEGM